LNHLTHWSALADDTWNECVDAALRHHRAGQTWTGDAHGRSLGLLFLNPSLRTRTSMELAGEQLGAHATTLDAGGGGTWPFAWGEGTVMDGDQSEHLRDAGGVLSRYFDTIGLRAFASLTDYDRDRQDAVLRAFADAATVPVVNMESAFYHPCQGLGDAATIAEHFDGDVQDRRFVLQWTYHPKPLPMAVANSALLQAARQGTDVTIARPDEYPLDAGIVEQARDYAEARGASLTETHDPDAAYDDADVIYAKAWAGRRVYDDPEGEKKLRESYRNWRVTPERMARTDEAIFMHCLPIRRNVVADDAVLDGPHAHHLTQAEFRLYAQKAILERLWGL
jgi:N-acetylornithine carbamoyltransferase